MAAMSIPLNRLPLVARIEVIKSMETREILIFSMVSEKSRNFVVLSLPKNSLWTDFVFRGNGLLFELKPAGFYKDEYDTLPYPSYSVRENRSLMRVCTDNRFTQCDVFSDETSEVEESIRTLFCRLLKTFKNQIIQFKFEDGTREEFAMELIRFTLVNGFPMDYIQFHLKEASSESIQELLNRCNEHRTPLHIETEFPEGFKLPPPPGGYKFGYLVVDNAHWINMDDFLQCRKVFFRTGIFGNPQWTAEYLNGLLKKIANLESRLITCFLELNRFDPFHPAPPIEFAAVVEGLSENEIQQTQEGPVLEFERKDGRKMRIYLHHDYHLRVTIV